MTTKGAVVRQYQAIVNRAAGRVGSLAVPPEGWVATVRKALGMSGAQLAERLGVTRARISQAERAEVEGGVTLKTMHAAAEAMGCRFVYAIVPKGRIEDIVAEQARKKARALVNRASGHMALESQPLSEEQNAEEAERIAESLLREMPADLWAEK
ncbi:MAG: mobile mystery protein A [Rhodospirillales bacterium]|nr:mobile mystery protein A [Rhodospirillales bacterium]